MVHADEFKKYDMWTTDSFFCPVCGSNLSLLRRIYKETEKLAILVMCDFCDDYHGFVISTGLKEDDLKKFIRYRKRPMNAKIEGYDWDEDDPE